MKTYNKIVKLTIAAATLFALSQAMYAADISDVVD
jgi:hypothetical protein